MKRILLSILTITALSVEVNAQDSTAFVASESVNFPAPAPPIPAVYASIQTLAGSNLRLSGDWTLEAWIKIGSSFGSQLHILETYSTTGSNGGFALRISGDRVQAFQIRNQSNSITSAYGTTTIPLNEWHHIAATLNETNQELKVYLDGQLEATSTTLITTLNNNSGLYIGARGDDQQVNGIVEIDDIKIWDYSKTDAEIEADTLACLTGNETGLLAWYDFEDVTSSALIDKSGNGNTGNLLNAVFSNRIYTCNSSTSISENNKETFSIYPNPTTSQLTIDIQEEIKNISIIDITGKTVKTITPTSKTINVSDLVKGIYFLQIQTNTGIANSKFIKNNY